MSAPFGPCGWCGRPSHSPERVCNKCIGIDSYANNVPTRKDALTGGRWVIDTTRRIQVWEPYFGPIEEAS